jgi:hypothetical protein
MVCTYPTRNPLFKFFTHLSFLLLHRSQCCARAALYKSRVPTCQTQPPDSTCHQTRVFARRSYRTRQDSINSLSIIVKLVPPSAHNSSPPPPCSVRRSDPPLSSQFVPSHIIPPSGLPFNFNFTYKGSPATLPCFTSIYPRSFITTCLFRHSRLIDFFRLSVSPFRICLTRSSPLAYFVTPPHRLLLSLRFPVQNRRQKDHRSHTARSDSHRLPREGPRGHAIGIYGDSNGRRLLAIPQWFWYWHR